MSTALPADSGARHVWGEIWRVGLSALLGVLLILAMIAGDIQGYQRGQTWIWVDVALGLLSLVALLFRRRWPFAVAMGLALLAAASTSAVGAASIALISLTTHRRVRQIVIACVTTMAAGLVFQWFHHEPQVNAEDWVSTAVVGILSIAFCLAAGLAIGARRQLVAGLHQRILDAENQQHLRVSQARVAERARIAREMHDVLAHRISLVAMHSGALAYRPDLPPAELQESVTVIRDNSHAALTELREILGVLRDPAASDGVAPEAPQPTVHDLPELIEAARRDGPVVLHCPPDWDGLTEQVSRGTYRIVQEGLTNRRKHAPGSRMQIDLRHETDCLLLTMRNPMPERVVTGESAVPGAGLGLIGSTERAALAGGELTAGQDRAGDFVIRARLPWRRDHDPSAAD